MATANILTQAFPDFTAQPFFPGMQVGTAQAIVAAVVLSPLQSGMLCTVSKAAAYAITVPAPSAGNVGLSYRFVSLAVGVGVVTISAGVAASIVGTIINNTPNAIPCNGQTISMLAAGVLGDSVEVLYVSATLIHARCVTSNAAGITVA